MFSPKRKFFPKIKLNYDDIPKKEALWLCSMGEDEVSNKKIHR